MMVLPTKRNPAVFSAFEIRSLSTVEAAPRQAGKMIDHRHPVDKRPQELGKAAMLGPQSNARALPRVLSIFSPLRTMAGLP